MIVPMKKISLIALGARKEQTLKLLRKLGLVHIAITEASGERIDQIRHRIERLERALYILGKNTKTEARDTDVVGALAIAEQLDALTREREQLHAEQLALSTELERLKEWGEIHPRAFADLADGGVEVSLYETSRAQYDALPTCVKTLRLEKTRRSVKFLLIRTGEEGEEEAIASLHHALVPLPEISTALMQEKIQCKDTRIGEIDAQIAALTVYVPAMQQAIRSLEKELEYEIYSTGMERETLSENGDVSVAYFTGYIEAEHVDLLRKAAAEHAWGLAVEDPTEEDHVPTKLKNNRFVSLIYPIMDFLGTVPGYFEYDISGWFLGFILIFFGIIFGDGGYGLLICAVAAVPIVSCLIKRKSISPTILLVGLFGLSTVLWGALTCTWFGLAADKLPTWLQSLSIPVISNVYADKIWYPFWTEGQAGLTTAQNLQIFCFSLALVQLTVAHIKGAVRNKGSMKMLGDIGSVLQMLGMFYLVLSLVVNSQVFTFGLVIGGIPVGTVAIALIGVGFVTKFVFANYEGSIIGSVLASMKDIVSVLLGVVNVFSDIVSYIRLWAVGLAGAAISATVNELVSPLLGNLMFMVLAIVLLVFGHGLNMILNVLSVIVHGIRLNTLEFSSHLDMSWSGHKFKPFEES